MSRAGTLDRLWLRSWAGSYPHCKAGTRRPQIPPETSQLCNEHRLWHPRRRKRSPTGRLSIPPPKGRRTCWRRCPPDTACSRPRAGNDPACIPLARDETESRAHDDPAGGSLVRLAHTRRPSPRRSPTATRVARPGTPQSESGLIPRGARPCPPAPLHNAFHEGRRAPQNNSLPPGRAAIQHVLPCSTRCKPTLGLGTTQGCWNRRGRTFLPGSRCRTQHPVQQRSPTGTDGRRRPSSAPTPSKNGRACIAGTNPCRARPPERCTSQLRTANTPRTCHPRPLPQCRRCTTRRPSLQSHPHSFPACTTRTRTSRGDAGRFPGCIPDRRCCPASTHMLRPRNPDTKTWILCPSPHAQCRARTSHSSWIPPPAERSQIHSEGTMSPRSQTGSARACTNRRLTPRRALVHIRDDTPCRSSRCPPSGTTPVHTFHTQPSLGLKRTARARMARTLSDPRPAAHTRADTAGMTWILARTARSRPCTQNMRWLPRQTGKSPLHMLDSRPYHSRTQRFHSRTSHTHWPPTRWKTSRSCS